MLLSVMPQLADCTLINPLFQLLPIALITGSNELLSLVLFFSFHKIIFPCISDLDGGEGKRTDHLVLIKALMMECDVGPQDAGRG